MTDISTNIGDSIIRGAEPPAKPAATQQAPQARTRYGPYFLLPSYRALAECAGQRKHGSLDFNRVLLFADTGQLLACDNARMIVAPISEVGESGAPLDPVPLDHYGYEVGPCTFILPIALFENLPQELAPGQSHLELTIDFDGKQWVATVMEAPLPNPKTHRSYALKHGLHPDPKKVGIPTSPGIAQVLALAQEESTRVLTIDTEHLYRLCAAMGSRVVRFYTHGRTGILRLEPTSADPNSIDPYYKYSVGLLMPWTDWDHEAEVEMRRTYKPPR